MEQNHNQQSNYLRFFAMIGTSMVIMYILMYVNSYQILDHAWFSETRLFMTTIMGGSMMAVMLSFMLGMYKNKKANVAIFVGAALMLLLSIWLVRSQITVDGVDYMEGMIPHHSIAILTSERAGIEDPRVRELADEIIEAQRKEIKEMEWLIVDGRPYELIFDENMDWIKAYSGIHRIDVRDMEAVVARPRSGDGRVKAPIPGLITHILVKEGQTVKTGESLVVLEAMKMENEIRATRDGVVQTVRVEPGQSVVRNEVLADIV